MARAPFVRNRRRATVGLAVAAMVLVGGSAAGARDAGTKPAPEVEREILMQTSPPQAPGYELYLYRVTIPVGGQIAPHHHPGTQGANIQRGVLSYTLISGSAEVVRDASSENPTSTTVTAPKTVKLRKGDTVIENTELVHEAANNGKKPVLILLSSLFTAGAPLSEPVG